jgi:hypothetical protein
MNYLYGQKKQITKTKLELIKEDTEEHLVGNIRVSKLSVADHVNSPDISVLGMIDVNQTQMHSPQPVTRAQSPSRNMANVSIPNH